ncbi:DUF1287 domain-containing protein [Oceaniferula marina]|nr:DUF1287 domain-containing protein [Oceaniferula marina]
MMGLLWPVVMGENDAEEKRAPVSGGVDLVEAARWQVGKTTGYNGAYVSLSYPNGDVPLATGVCTDVVIRAMRRARKMDLQKLVHLDMRAHFSKYPNHWGLKRTDRSIDHRRVPNLKTYFDRCGWSVKVSKNKEDYLPGDLVTCTVAGKLPHMMVVSDRRAEDGTPLIIHNIGAGVKEESLLFEFPITGHFRLPAAPAE